MRHEVLHGYDSKARAACHLLVFDSAAEHIAESGQALVPRQSSSEPLNQARIRQRAALDRPGFIGRSFSDWKSVVAACDSAWTEGLDILDRMLAELAESGCVRPPRSCKRRGCYRDDDGDEVDLDRLRLGKPFWRTTARENRVGTQTVTIVADMSTSAKVAHDRILWRGAAAICLTKLLEQAGYRVELLTVEHCHASYLETTEGSCHAVWLKRASDPLDMSTIASAVSGWYYRTVEFATHFIVGKLPTECLGYPRPLTPVLPHITPDNDPIVAERLWDRQAAVDWVKRALERFA